MSRTFWFQQERAEANAVWSQVVLVRKTSHLCLLEDSGSPSAFPNVASLEAGVSAAIAAGQCYTPR